MTGYRHQKLQKLEKQLLLSPKDVRVLCADRLEQLLCDLPSDARYPYRGIYWTITGFQLEEETQDSYLGGDLRPDLLRMLRTVSATCPCRATSTEDVIYRPAELAGRLRVSAKTVQRWREKALISRAYVFPDGRVRVGIRSSNLDRFLTSNSRAVSLSSRFSLLSEREKAEMLALARRYRSLHGIKLSAAAERVSLELCRAKETVRSVLKTHEARHPDAAVFRDTPRKFQHTEKQEILTAYREGTPVALLTHRSKHSRSSIYRIINQARALAILEAKINYVYNAEFLEENADEQILGSPVARAPEAGNELPTLGREAPSVDATTSVLSPLTKEEETRSFRRYNYLKFKASQLRAKIDAIRWVPSTVLDKVEGLLSAAQELKNMLLEANLPLCAMVARKHAGLLVPVSHLTSEGLLCLMRVIETFDYSRGTRFSTYATWALMRHFAKTVPEENYARARLVPTEENVLEDLMPPASQSGQEESELAAFQEQVPAALRNLTPREREVISFRFGLRGPAKIHTLTETGERLGISAERVRQIEVQALEKLRFLIEQ